MFAETIEFEPVRRSSGNDKDTRDGVVAGVNYLCKSLERGMGMEDATKEGQVQEFLCKKLQRQPGQSLAERVNVLEWVNVLEKAVRDIKIDGLS